MVAAPRTARAAKPTQEGIGTKPDLRCRTHGNDCSAVTDGRVGKPWSAQSFPLQWVCHLIHSPFISSSLSFRERVSRMFMYASFFFEEHAKTKFLSALEILQMKYKAMYTWVARTVLSLHYSQYHFPLVNLSDFSNCAAVPRTFQWQ